MKRTPAHLVGREGNKHLCDPNDLTDLMGGIGPSDVQHKMLFIVYFGKSYNIARLSHAISRGAKPIIELPEGDDSVCYKLNSLSV